jgi:hypothetical protein
MKIPKMVSCKLRVKNQGSSSKEEGHRKQGEEEVLRNIVTCFIL